MTIASFIVSVLALVVAAVAVGYARLAANAADRQAVEANRQADAAHEELRIATTPQLTVTLQKEPARGPDLLYEIRNDGPRDLDVVLVQRPQTRDKIRYPIALLGGSELQDEVDLGPLGLGEAAVLLLKVGPTQTPPEFRVRITCRSGKITWHLSHLLEPRIKPTRLHTF